MTTIPKSIRPRARGNGKWQQWLRGLIIFNVKYKGKAWMGTEVKASDIPSIRAAARSLGIKITTRLQEDGSYLVWRLS